ncbi:efflux transporter periplasmic adaptor subunit [Hydrogenimonas sp. SS33]|uniref:efflux RND transporter periplasmic adaptor subunit n=1 Tax=Hydrogenimonas leucolamina TaxID=2954236 RepID=UPI00336C1A17
MKKGLRVLIILAVIAILVLLAVRAVKHKKAEEAAIPPAKPYAVVVHTITPQVQKVTLSLPFIALVHNDNDTVVASKLAARVVMIDKPGAKVKRGEPVAKLDTTDLEAKLHALQAQIASAKSGLAAQRKALENLKAIHARTQKLLAVRGASREQYDTETTKIAATEAQIAETKAKIASLRSSVDEVTNLLSYALIKAPVSGTVGKTFVNAGDMAMPGKPLMSITADKGAYLLVRLPGDLKPKALIYQGKRMALYDLHHTFNGLREYRTATLERPLTTGERVDVDIVTFEGEGLKLPVDAVLADGNSHKVLTAEKGHTQIHTVEVKARGEHGMVVAADDLAGKQVIVAKPDVMLRLLTGVPVKAVGERAGK